MEKEEFYLIEKLINDYGTMVSSICRRMMKHEEIAKDVAQEVWLEIIKSIHSFKGESKLSTWIYTITYRVSLRFINNERLYTSKFLRQYFRKEEFKSSEFRDHDESIWVKEMCDKCLSGVLQCLNKENRLAYIFRDIVQLPYAEIATIFNKKEDSVRKIVSRSRRKLKNFLSSECILQNCNGKCKCRMKNLVIGVNLPQEYKKIRKIIGKANLYFESNQILPQYNYWNKYL
ncbi:RNA polymerase sigma factor [Clostridium sp. WILCCON 0269]|uniref:RNA polymerase sigma factor n=1 Tax=Candidatus Clostridium eludens TaxID=3381663 RepID=A0ABW8SRR5_9CLOT